MGKATKIAIGLSIASGALLAAWLLTGSRKEKTKAFISRRTTGLRTEKKKDSLDDSESEAHYI